MSDLQTKRRDIDPKFLVAGINPRELSDLQAELLMPAIEKTNGIITKPLVVWMPVDEQGEFDAKHPIWSTVHDTLTNQKLDIPVDERHKYRILVQGHRREWCLSTITNNPSKYNAEMVKNASKAPCLEIACSREQADEIALDFEDSANLHSWNIVKLVTDRLARDFSYQEIAVQIPRLLFSVLLTNGEAKYNALLRDPKNQSGEARVAAIKCALKNRLDTHYNSCHLFGPAMVQQLLLHYRYTENQLSDVGDKDKLVLNLKYQIVRDLRALYTKIQKEDEPWSPVTTVGIVEKCPDGTNPDVSFRPTPGGTGVSGRYFVVEGGHPEFREALLKLMHVYQKPEDKEEEAKPPTATERNAVKAATQSGIGKANVAYFNASNTEEVAGKFITEARTRAQWEEWALFVESTHAKLANIRESMSPVVQELIDALINQSAPIVGAERVEAALSAVNAEIGKKPANAKK